MQLFARPIEQYSLNHGSRKGEFWILAWLQGIMFVRLTVLVWNKIPPVRTVCLTFGVLLCFDIADSLRGIICSSLPWALYIMQYCISGMDCSFSLLHSHLWWETAFHLTGLYSYWLDEAPLHHTSLGSSWPHSLQPTEITEPIPRLHTSTLKMEGAPKLWCLPTGLHNVATQNTTVWTVTTLEMSKLILYCVCLCRVFTGGGKFLAGW
jgi:hypothetical protein